MNKIAIYLITAFITVAGTFVANKIQLRKVKKPLARHIQHLQKDSTAKVYAIKKLNLKLDSLRAADSLKSEFVSQFQKTLLEIQKQNWKLKADTTAKSIVITDLKSWIADAQDGVIIKTDTVRLKKKFFGGYKII